MSATQEGIAEQQAETHVDRDMVTACDANSRPKPFDAVARGFAASGTDFDTGDSGTLYAATAMLDRLREQDMLEPDGERWRLHGLGIGGVIFNPTTVRVVEAASREGPFT